MKRFSGALVRLLLLSATLSSGCAGSLFKTQVAPPKLYLLSMQGAAPAETSAAAEPAVAVLRPRVRAGLDTDRIAALYPDRHLDYFADARWSGPLDEVVQDLVVQLFHSQAGLRNVSGDASAFASPFWLEMEVADFQAEYAANGAPPTVRVHFLARIGRPDDKQIIARLEAEVRRPAAENRLGAIVDAYNLAANQALLQIAAGCAPVLATESTKR